MKHITLLFTLSLSFMVAFVLHTGNEKIKTGLESSSHSASVIACSPACQLLDSLTLVDIYNATNVPGWTTPWILTDPVCQWPGITLNASGNVTSIVLNNNNLVGAIPAEISNLAATLSILQIDNNCLSGPIPSEIGDCINLQTLFLDNNKLTGTIPESFGQMTSLLTLFLDNNLLTGTIPDTFLNMTSLQNLDIFNNCFDSIPDLSSMISLQPNKFRVQNNKFTFDDLLPNWFEIGTYYEPQDSFGVPITICLPTGLDTFVDLGIDAGVTTNTYQWFRGGTPYSTTTTNKLHFNPVDWGDAGTYTTNVTNSIMTDLTLHGRPIIVKVVCGQSTEVIKNTYCSGSGDNVVVGATVFDESFPSGTVDVADLDQYGCDSIVVVDLTYYASPPVIIDTMLCPGQSITVNGQVYDESLTSGIENLGPVALFGCDSTIDVTLTYYTTSVNFLSPTICRDDSLEVYGKYYHIGNPSGIDTISGVAFHGCDSIIDVNLSFHPLPLAVFDDVLCSGNSMTIGGIEFNQGNPSDTLVLTNSSVLHGCDSIIYVDLTFGAGVEITIDDVLCDGESIVVGSNTYDQSTPMDTLFFLSSGPPECDTTIYIDLSFYVPDTGYYSPVLCEGDSVTFNGSVYDNATPSGTEILSSEFYPACDSIVEVQLTFLPAPSTSIDTTLCPGEFIEVNSVVYDFLMPSGVETISGSGLCDSTVTVNLSFFPEVVTNIDSTLCVGEFIIVDGTICDVNNPVGSFTLSGQSFNGCDSTINVNLEFYPEAINTIDTTLCFGESIMVNSTEYNAGNPSDTIIMGGASFHECDSTIYINLEFYSEASGTFMTVLCPGDSTTINGTVYHEGNTDGVEFFPLGSFHGCDSTLTVHVDFYAVAETSIDSTLCFGESLLIGGVLFDANNTSDTIVLNNATANACDSTIYVNLNFLPEAFELINPTLCFGQTLEVNDSIYSEVNPAGMDTIFGGSFYGCDSIIQVDITFNSAVEITIDDMLCCGDSMIINSVIYNKMSPSGTETIVGGSYLGCDSVIVVDLQFPAAPAESTLDGFHCSDVSFIVNSVPYDIDNPMGTEVMGGASFFGCDSTVYIDLQFFDDAVYELDTTLCPGGSIVIDDVVYDESNPSGVEIIENSNYNGCDSTIIITLSFFEPSLWDYAPVFCEGQSITIEGTTYDINNPSDTIVSATPSFHGCDSTIYINISFSDAVETFIAEKLCPGDSIIVNNVVYNEGNPMGEETIEMGSYTDCDSIIHVDLDFYLLDDLSFDLHQSMCPGDSVIVNGTVYNEGNPTGLEIISNVSYSGCDSIVDIQLSYYAPAIFNYTDIICPEGSVEFNNIVYDINNPSGNDTIPGVSLYGCDSIIMVALSFYDSSYSLIDTMICEGESIVLNGTVYDANNTMGFDTLPGASFNGCDSIVEVQLSFYQMVVNSIVEEICDGESYMLNNTSYTATGSYSEVFINGSYMGCDSTVNLELTVLTAEAIGLADAGEDLDICEDEVSLSANTPAGTSGVWTNMEGANISTPLLSNTMATGLSAESYSFIWTLSNSACINYDADTVVIFVEANPEANDDTYTAEPGLSYLELNLIDNDNLNGISDWSLDIPNPPAGNLTDLGPGNFGFEADPSLMGTTLSFEYMLCNESCTFCDTALVFLTFEEIPVDPNRFPNAITPNDDGFNDVFIIPLLEDNPERYHTRELIIFNRWGDIVFQAQPYLNDWNGKSESGKNLPEGTYYYILRLDLAEGIIFKGDISILR